MDTMFRRVSVREFDDEPLEPKTMKKLMRAAMTAPSAGNQQPWEFYLVTDAEKRGKLAACSKFAGPAENAPLVIVACSRNRGMRHGEYVIQDMSACVENILLEAVELGLGAVWLGIAPREGRMELVRNVLNIPAHLDPFALIAVGHPAGEVPEQKNRFEIDRVHFVTLPEERFA